MASLKHVVALALLTTAVGFSSRLSAAQIGGPVSGPPPPSGGVWTARVCWPQGQWIDNIYYQYACTTITATSYGECHLQLTGYTASANVRVVYWCTQS